MSNALWSFLKSQSLRNLKRSQAVAKGEALHVQVTHVHDSH